MAAVSEAADPGLVRRCPTCGAENEPAVMRCACGALLAGVDLVRRAPPAAEAAPAPAAAAKAAATRLCPHEDCGQANPADAESCLYCNRPFADEDEAGPAPVSLLALPGPLRERYRIVRPFPAAGAEAEILLVEPAGGGEPRIAKVYRSGIRPKPEVLAQIARVDRRHRVDIIESGVADGHAWELMEYCAHGSLRERLRPAPLAPEMLKEVIRELAAALADVHAARLVHRDLKPENVLVRSESPLDLVLTDFGIASVLDATQRFTGTARSLAYAAPETLSGLIDAKADYWALGMIALEAALGRHPFAGLSEAVVLHHLATRGIDLGGVREPGLRKLLRGLLLRDPKARWGAPEVGRWLAGDASLAEAVEAEDAAFGQPYRLADECCATPEQLAVALARHWRAGVADLGNGQLLEWFRNVQKDHNTVRLLLELQHERQMHVDLRLLHLIVHLAPGIPPVWRGDSVELPAVLGRAARALKGDAEAAAWLDEVYRQRVLEVYAAAGNPAAADLVERWSAAADRFATAWDERAGWLKERSPGPGRDEVVRFDDVVFGRGGPQRPSLLAMHPRLLAAAYDPAWAGWLRRKLAADSAALAAACPWLAELGDPVSLAPAELLVLDALLPEARKAAERQRAARAEQERNVADDLQKLRAESELVLGDLRGHSGRLLTPSACGELRLVLERYQGLLARIRAGGRSDPAWMNLRKRVVRAEPFADRIQEHLDRLIERRTANAGWFSREAAGFAFFAVVVAPVFLPPRMTYLPLAAVLGLIAWRLLPNFLAARRIRELAGKL